MKISTAYYHLVRSTLCFNWLGVLLKQLHPPPPLDIGYSINLQQSFDDKKLQNDSRKVLIKKRYQETTPNTREKLNWKLKMSLLWFTSIRSVSFCKMSPLASSKNRIWTSPHNVRMKNWSKNKKDLQICAKLLQLYSQKKLEIGYMSSW